MQLTYGRESGTTVDLRSRYSLGPSAVRLRITVYEIITFKGLSRRPVEEQSEKVTAPILAERTRRLDLPFSEVFGRVRQPTFLDDGRYIYVFSLGSHVVSFSFPDFDLSINTATERSLS